MGVFPVQSTMKVSDGGHGTDVLAHAGTWTSDDQGSMSTVSYTHLDVYKSQEQAVAEL